MVEAGRDLWRSQVQPLAANRSCAVWIWASPRLQMAPPLCAPVSVSADKVKNCLQSLIWLPGVVISVTVASPPTSVPPLRRSQLCFLSSLPLGHRWQQQFSLLASSLNWLSPAFLASLCRCCGPASTVLVTVPGCSSCTQCCHSLVCRSCLHHEGTLLPRLPRGAQWGSAHPPVPTQHPAGTQPALLHTDY